MYRSEEFAAMKYRQLGRDGPRVSAIGLGCLSLSLKSGSPDYAEARATLDRALELGVNFLDTADAYGDGTSEQFLADALRTQRERIFIATKFGNLRGGGGDRKVDGRPEYVQQACEASLKRLGVDVIDLYYLHRVDPLVPIEDTIGAMKKLVEGGKVRYVGLSEASVQSIERAHATHPVTALQSEYSLWSREPEDAVLQTCRALGIGFVPYAPLGRGLLTGTISSAGDLAPNDRRLQNPRFESKNLARNIATLAPLQAIAQRLSATPAQVALAWVLAQGDDVVPIPGTKRRRYLEVNAGAVDLALTSADVAALSQAFPRGVATGARHNFDAMQLMNG
jgi:aryl-alcohol dehydrogenase-like predicted oxidoreductase